MVLLDRIKGGVYMICPVCKQEIPNTSLSCPLCNTRFSCNSPSSIQESNIEAKGPIESNQVFTDGKLGENTYNSSAGISVSPLRDEVSNNASINNSVNNSNSDIGNKTTLINESLPNGLTPDNIIRTSVGAQQLPVEMAPFVSNQTVADTQNIESVSVDIANTVGSVNGEFRKTKEKQKEKENIFFILVIIFGLAVLLVIAFSMMSDSRKTTQTPTTSRVDYTHKVTPLAETKNVGKRSSFDYPMAIGNTTLASYYDRVTKQYTDVDVTGIRFITGDEALALANSYSKEQLYEGFMWFGFEYRVQLNDLTYLNGRKINPTLNAKFYKWTGCDFINYNEHNYVINISTSSPDVAITNGESATLRVIYQVPEEEGEYSICLGYLDNTFGCFAKN